MQDHRRQVFSYQLVLALTPFIRGVPSCFPLSHLPRSLSDFCKPHTGPIAFVLIVYFATADSVLYDTVFPRIMNALKLENLWSSVRALLEWMYVVMATRWAITFEMAKP